MGWLGMLAGGGGRDVFGCPSALGVVVPRVVCLSWGQHEKHRHQISDYWVPLGHRRRLWGCCKGRE
jgi:hypothetical protein